MTPVLDVPEPLQNALRGMTDRSLERAAYRTRVEARKCVKRDEWDAAECALWSGLHQMAQAERNRRQAPTT